MYLPWVIYGYKGLQWKNNYAPNQGNIGTCALLATMNAANTSNLTNMVRTNIKAPEINSSIAYASARTNGRWGSGCNLNPLSRAVMELGNHLVKDVGAYDTSGSALRRANAITNANALKYQSNVIYVPGKKISQRDRFLTPSFDDVHLVCSAGFGVVMGTGTYPTAAKVGRRGLAVPSAWKKGGHAEASAAGIEEMSEKLLYLLNSHGYRYEGDKYFEGRQPGKWIGREDLMMQVPKAMPAGTSLAMDKAYEGDACRAKVVSCGMCPVVPPKSNRKEPWEYDKELYKGRNVVERNFRRIKQFRRVFTRYDKLDITYNAFIAIAHITLFMKC